MIAKAQEGGDVIDREWTEDGIQLRIRGHRTRIEKLLKKKG